MINRKRFVWLLIIGFSFSFYFFYGVENQSLIKSSIQIKTAVASLNKELYLPNHQDFRIVVISDLNSQYGSTQYEPEVDQAIALINQWQPDLVLCGGDMIAGQKASLTKLQIEAMWQAFDRHIALPLRQNKVPFGFTIGNHDGSGTSKNKASIFEAERKLAHAYWHQKQHRLGLNFVDRANFPFHYSFKQNDIFFLVWDASTQDISKPQLAWVKQALASPIAQNATARIAIGHLPLYPVATAKNKPGEYLANGPQLRSLLEQNQVQVYISGHHHAYYPGKKSKLELLHAGALGQGERQLIGSNSPAQKTVTVVDIDVDTVTDTETATSQLTYTTYDASTWELIPLNQLPESITGEYGTIFRRDL
jgi:predicted MPP superfamily phosphohydrolase